MFDNTLKKKPKRLKSLNENYHYTSRLLKNRKINKEFIEKLKFLTIEELIYLKLDSATANLNGKLIGFPIYKFISDISKEACVKYALSTTKSKKDAALILNISKTELNRLIKLYEIELE